MKSIHTSQEIIFFATRLNIKSINNVVKFLANYHKLDQTISTVMVGTIARSASIR